MNAAAKGIHQGNFFHGELKSLRFSKIFCMQMTLLLTVLVSALAVVYFTNVHRLTVSQLEHEEQRAHHLQLQWGQLLLEQASLATPARVEQLAIKKLHMQLPSERQMLVLHAR